MTRDQSLELFAAATAHDLRTPLSALSGEVELALRRERSPAAYREALQRIAERVAELVDLTADLALLGPPDEHPASAQATANVGGVLDLVASRCRACGVAIEPTPGPLMVCADESRLGRALTRLVEHAARYGGAAPRLRITETNEARADDGYVDIVLDGVPPGHAPRIWQPLMRPEGEAAGRAPGLFRLRVAARIVEDSGGSVTVQSSEGSASVRIRLPRAAGAG